MELGHACHADGEIADDSPFCPVGSVCRSIEQGDASIDRSLVQLAKHRFCLFQITMSKRSGWWLLTASHQSGTTSTLVDGEKRGTGMTKPAWNKPELTPKELAERSGIAISALHFYERKGLIFMLLAAL